MNKKRDNWGGKRPNSGNTKGVRFVKERRKSFSLSVLPSSLLPFKKKHGEQWHRVIEAFMIEDVKK